ncbi:MAG: zinc transport system substrate-binding protein [Pseudomonadota bacterium]|nr:zinc transport system substrate-binding protein [Pseudomonadota bacterium]
MKNQYAVGNEKRVKFAANDNTEPAAHYMKHDSFAVIFIAIILILKSGVAAAATPQILVTLKPLHSLVSGLSHGISQPSLLLDDMQSPHDYQLKPSDRRLLASANIIIYASDNIESFMQPLSSSLGSRQLIALDTLPGMPLLPARSTDADHHDNHRADYDGHIWLSPLNARIIVQQLAEMLVQYDPANRNKYFSNRDHLLQRLNTLEKKIDQQLLPVRNQPFLQFHDALQYFERDFSLNHGVTVTSGAEHAPGARHIRALQQQIREKKINCFLYEPPQAPKLLETLDVNRSAKKQALEIHGSQITAGGDLYFSLLENIAGQIHECLQP